MTARDEETADLSMQALMAASGIGQWSLEIATGRLVASDFLGRLLELPRGDALDEGHLLEAIHPDDRAAFIDRLAGCVESGQPFQLVHRIATKAQPERHVETRGLLITDNALRPIRVAAVTVEIDS